MLQQNKNLKTFKALILLHLILMKMTNRVYFEVLSLYIIFKSSTCQTCQLNHFFIFSINIQAAHCSSLLFSNPFSSPVAMVTAS